MNTRYLTLAAVSMLSAGVWTAAGPPGEAPDAIRLDAIVTDNQDRPIRDLKLSDFSITDNGDDRPVESATLESGRDGRLVAIFLDEYHVQPGDDTARSRAALTQFVDVELRPADFVAVMKPLDSLKAIQVTQDRDLLRAAIGSFTGRKGDYVQRTPFERNFMSRAPAQADASRAQVVSSALQALALRIGAFREGRKAVVLVSEGFTPSLPRGSDRLTGSLRAIVYAANRYGVSIYPIDPRRPPNDTDSERETSTLQALAEQTGGEATRSGIDLMPGMKQAADDLDDYYVLTYRAPGSGDGSFHPVQLRVKRAGAQIRVRSGYWAANPEFLRPFPSLTTRATTIPMRPSHASTLIRPWIGTSLGPDGLTSVTVTWEPGQAPPRNQRVGSVLLKATADDGRVLFQQPIGGRATFDATPGHIQLEMTIEGEDGKTLDSDYRGMDVPNLRVSRPTFATVQVMRTRSAREFARASADPSPAPVASREFSRGERLLIRIPIYGADAARLAVTATLLNPLGSPMRALSPVPADLPQSIVQFDLPLSSLAPDDYRVEVVATAGGQEAKTVLLFRVTN